MPPTRNGMVRRVPTAERSDLQRTTSPSRKGRACGRCMRCLPGARVRTWSPRLETSVAVAVLAVLQLILPATPADAACETSKGFTHREAAFPCTSWNQGHELSTSGGHSQTVYLAHDRVVATVALEVAMDRTSHLVDRNRRGGATVPVLYDRQEEGEETLPPSTPRRARNANPPATGTILDGNRSPTVWLGSFERKVARMSEYPAVGVRDLPVTLGGLRIGPRQSLEEGESAGIADIDRWRLGDWTWDRSAHVADDSSTRTGSSEMTGRDPLSGSSFLFAADQSADPGRRWLGRGQEAPMRFAGAHGSRGDGLIGLFGAECDRRRLLAGVARSSGVGEVGLSTVDRHGLGDSLSGVYPYVREAPTEWLSGWCDFDFATAKLTLTDGGGN